NELCKLAKELTVDSRIYSAISIVGRTLSSKYGKTTFSQQQRVSIAGKLQALIDNKLPVSDYIKHDGYKVLSRAQVNRILNARTEKWDAIIADARAIDNLADRSLVLACLA